jgi:hypothetical protein
VAKTWVLDSETKGTGASVVPLERVLRRASAERELALVKLTPSGGKAPAPTAQAPAALRFRVVDVLNGKELGRDLSTREALARLAQMSSALDARVYTWIPGASRWRLLTLEEHRLMWRFRARVAEGQAAAVDAGAGPNA